MSDFKNVFTQILYVFFHIVKYRYIIFNFLKKKKHKWKKLRKRMYDLGLGSITIDPVTIGLGFIKCKTD